jgi:hypothetical protein
MHFYEEDLMKRSRIRTALVITLALLLTTTAIAGARNGANPGVLPPTSRVQGLTYGRWSAQWWQFVFSLPVSQNPLAGGTGANCAFKRVGNVGLVVLNSTMGGQLTCEAPAGTMLFLELLDSECSNLETDPFYGGNEAELRACAKKFVPVDMKASIDGVAIQNPEQYISMSPMYNFVVPEDNILGVPGGSTGKSVAYGAFLMLAPLTPGKHTIHTHGAYPAFDFTADRNLELTVTRPR